MFQFAPVIWRISSEEILIALIEVNSGKEIFNVINRQIFNVGCSVWDFKGEASYRVMCSRFLDDIEKL